jgi:hypothetical protein
MIRVTLSNFQTHITPSALPVLLERLGQPDGRWTPLTCEDESTQIIPAHVLAIQTLADTQLEDVAEIKP